MPTPDIPAEVGPYRVKRELGRGGMGVVYLAHDPRLERDVAIKTLAPEIARDADRLARFKREARLVAQLNHPHIAQIYHLLEHHGVVYLVLEFVPGRSLSDMILDDGPLALTTALDIGEQVACAVEVAHSRGIVHRDLKPANIRVTDDGTAKVLDFGVARIVGDEDHPDDDERPMIGTPGYMAPEQVRREPADARVDVFAFGCVLFECLTGVRAIAGDTLGALLTATLNHDPDWSRLPDRVPEAVQSMIRSCLVRPAHERLPSISEARAALSAQLGRHTPVTVSAQRHDTLPRPTTSFVGRTDDLAKLVRLIEGARLATLIGPGGCGKTRLALELARRAMRRFPDGVYLAELAPTTNPDLVPSAVAAALGVKDQAGRTTLEALSGMLAGKSVLLILDNCEHVLTAASSLVGALLRAAPDLRVIATSRESLHVPGEHLWPVAGLSLPSGDDPAHIETAEAVRLFVERGRALRPGFRLDERNAPVIARICRRLDGIPLAIELAAGRIRTLTPAEIDAHLDDRFRLLRSEGDGFVERHRTLEAAVDWSYRQLGESEQAMLRRLSVFAGGWTLEAATAVCGPDGHVENGHDLDDFGVLDELTRLVNKSLVVAGVAEGESRYGLLETVRLYAAARLTEAEEEARTFRLLFDFILTLAEKAEPELSGPSQSVWMERLQFHHDTMLAALDHLDQIEAGAVRALRLCRALMRFWLVRGHYRRGQQACALVLAHRGARPRTGDRGAALHAAAVMAQSLGEYDRAESLASEALDIHREIGNRPGMALSLNSLGNSAYYRGDLEEARRLHEESLAIRRELNDQRGTAMSLNNLANVAHDLGHISVAKRLYEESVRINRQRGNRASEAINLFNLALLAYRSDDVHEAKRLHEQSLAIRRDLGDQHGIAESLNQMGKLARVDGDHEHARQRYAESLALRRNLGEKLGLTDSLDECIMLAIDLGEPAQGARLLGGVELLRDRIGAPRPPAEQAELDQRLTAARETLGAAVFQALVQEGRDRPLDETLIDASAWLDADDLTTTRPADTTRIGNGTARDQATRTTLE